MNGVVPFDDEGFAEFFTLALEDPSVALWAGDCDGEIVAIAGALAFPLYFNPKCRVAQELYWWSAPKARGTGAGQALRAALEKWAAEVGAQQLFMIALADDRLSSMDRLYRRAGFVPMEHTYRKGL